MGGGNGCTAVRMYLMLLNSTPETGGKFSMLYMFCHNTRDKETNMHVMAKGLSRESKCTYIFLKYSIRTFSVRSRQTFCPDLHKPIITC